MSLVLSTRARCARAAGGARFGGVAERRTSRSARSNGALDGKPPGLKRDHRHVLPLCEASEGDVGPTSSKAEGQVCDCGLCDGSARIIGGMGAIPGFGWWPIKAYRPCPNYTKSGKTYQRKGQILDKILFGRDGSNEEVTF